jgi:putative ABC transport system permease protein
MISQPSAVDQLKQDIRYAWRQMVASPGFAIVAVLTLGLGIGANTAIFSIVDSILLTPLPYSDSERLVRVVENVPAEESFSGAPERTTRMNPGMFVEWRDRSTTLSGMSMERSLSVTMSGAQAVRLVGLEVSPSMFSILGAQPILGRAFEPTEEVTGSDNVVVLSYGAWQRYFGGDAFVLGTTVILDAAAYTVIGVMPTAFAYPNAQMDFWKPLAFPLRGQVLGLPVIARLEDGVSIEAAEAEANTISRELRGDSSPVTGQPRVQLVSVKEELVGPIRLPLLVFVVAVGFVLLVACVNVANLFLARATSRTREVAIRMALGASRARVLRQILTENMLLAVLGGALGIALAAVGARLFVAVGQGLARAALNQSDAVGNAIPRLNEIAVDFNVLTFTCVITVATGLLFGLIPAFQMSRPTVARTAQGLSRGASKITLRRLRTGMVIGQIALTLVLLLGAGLLIKSFINLINTDLGYDPTNVLTFNIPQPPLSFPADLPSQRQRTEFEEEVARRIGSLPTVEAVGFTNALPMVQMHMTVQVQAPSSSTAAFGADMYTVSHDYFRAIGMRLVEGRGFNEEDRRGVQPVYVVNRAFAKAYFQDQGPIGRRLNLAQYIPAGEVVGVVEDVRHLGIDSEPQPIVFVDPEHTIGIIGVAEGGVYFTVRTRRDPTEIISEIRTIVRNLDATLVVDNVATMDQIVANSITTPRSYAVLLGAFAVAALVLAMSGLYGVQAYVVTQRRQEIGIRMALGAEAPQVLLQVLRQGLLLGVSGLLVGLVGSLVLTKFLATMLFGLTTLDVATYVAVCATFLAVMVAASYLPARQAAKIDPQLILRYE